MRRFTILASIAFVVPALALGACGSATIERIGAPNLEARIVGSDDRNVYVISDDDQTFAVPRRTIRDIDHPGNVLVTVGACLLSMTALTYLSNESGGQESGGIFAAVGVPLFIGGLIPWLQSTRAADNTDPGGFVEDREPSELRPRAASRPPRRPAPAPQVPAAPRVPAPDPGAVAPPAAATPDAGW